MTRSQFVHINPTSHHLLLLIHNRLRRRSGVEYGNAGVGWVCDDDSHQPPNNAFPAMSRGPWPPLSVGDRELV